LLSIFFFYVKEGEAPELIEPLTDYEVTMPEEVTLECDFEPGNPPAAIHWYKDNKEIYASKKHQLSFTDGTASLYISPTAAVDSGKYRCEATNKHGKATTECSLAVQCKYGSGMTVFLS